MNPNKNSKNEFSNQQFTDGSAPFFPFREVFKDESENDIEAAQNDFVSRAGMPSQPTEPGQTE